MRRAAVTAWRSATRSLLIAALVSFVSGPAAGSETEDTATSAPSRVACSAGTSLTQIRRSVERTILPVGEEDAEHLPAGAGRFRELRPVAAAARPRLGGSEGGEKEAEDPKTQLVAEMAKRTEAVTAHADTQADVPKTQLVSDKVNRTETATAHADTQAADTQVLNPQMRFASLLARLGGRSREGVQRARAAAGRLNTQDYIVVIGVFLLVVLFAVSFATKRLIDIDTPRDRAAAAGPILGGPARKSPQVVNVKPGGALTMTEERKSVRIAEAAGARLSEPWMVPGTSPQSLGSPYALGGNLAGTPGRMTAGSTASIGKLTDQAWPTALGEDKKNLCPALVVPAGCECVLLALRDPKGGSLDVRDKSGRVVLSAVTIGMTSVELCTTTGEPMARCDGGGGFRAGSCEYKLLWPWGEHYGTLTQSNEGDDRYILDCVGGNRLNLWGAFSEHCVNVTDESGRLLATAEPIGHAAFDPSGDYFNVRVAPFVDAGLMLCCILCLTNQARMKNPG